MDSLINAYKPQHIIIASTFFVLFSLLRLSITSHSVSALQDDRLDQRERKQFRIGAAQVYTELLQLVAAAADTIVAPFPHIVVVVIHLVALTKLRILAAQTD